MSIIQRAQTYHPKLTFKMKNKMAESATDFRALFPTHLISIYTCNDLLPFGFLRFALGALFTYTVSSSSVFVYIIHMTL